MPTKLVSALGYIAVKRHADDSEAYRGTTKEAFEEYSILINATTEAGTMEIEYPGMYGSSEGSYTIRGACVIFPGDTARYPVDFSGSRSVTVPAQGVATGTVTAPALTAGQSIKVRHIHHGGSGLRQCYNKFLWDNAGPDKATFADRGTTSLTTLDAATFTPGTYFSQGVSFWVGIVPNIKANVATSFNSSYKAVYIATHSFGDWSYDIPRGDLASPVDSGKYEAYTIWGRLLAKKGYCCIVDQVNGGGGDNVVSDWSNPQRQRYMDLVALAGGNARVFDHYWINNLRVLTGTATSSIQGLAARVALYNTKSIPTMLSTSSPSSDSTDAWNTITNQTEWGVWSGAATANDYNEWKDAVRWVRGQPLQKSTNLAAIAAGTIPASAAALAGVVEYIDVLGVLSPDPNKSLWYPSNYDGTQASSATDLNITSDGLHPGVGPARALQLVNPPVINYTAIVPAYVVVLPTLKVPRGGSIPIPLYVYDADTDGIGSVTVLGASDDTDICTIGSSKVTDGTGFARFDGASAATVPVGATVGDTVELTFTAGTIQATVTVEVVEALLESSGGGGGSLINGGLIG